MSTKRESSPIQGIKIKSSLKGGLVKCFFWAIENITFKTACLNYYFSVLTRFSSYKVHSENCQAENCRKSKNILRMFGGSNSIQHRNLSMNLHKIWWCLLLMLHFYVKTILNTVLYTSLYHYRYADHKTLCIDPG